MGQIKTKLIKTFYTLLHKTSLKQYKENIVLGFTEGKTTHISDLTPKDIKKTLFYHTQTQFTYKYQCRT